MNIESRLIVFTQNIKMLSEKNKLSSPVFSLVTLFQYEVGKNNVRTLHYSIVETRGGGGYIYFLRLYMAQSGVVPRQQLFSQQLVQSVNI